MKQVLRRSLLVAGLVALSLQQAVAGGSQFIDNMPQLTQDPDRPGAMLWQKPGFNRAAYSKVMIPPVTIFISPDSEYQGINADELKALSDGFIKAITTTLEPDIAVINEKGPGVLLVNAALTNVKVAKKSRGLLSFTPIGLLVHAAEDAAGKDISVKDAVLQIEMLDSMTGERVGVLVDNAPKTAGADLSWDSINKTFVFYAERFKSRLQGAKQASGGK